jgi:hypothetical protein
MNRIFPTPTVELVKARCYKFDHDPSTQLVENAVRSLWATYPQNDVETHVLLKVLVLNKLYSTWVNDIDVAPLSRHITERGIDLFLEQGSTSAVELICDCPKLKRYFSFATKFCSWHNPIAYPIYDRNVDECLWAYRNQDHFAKFQRQNLRKYPVFYDTMIAFRDFYKLGSFTFRELDKFLWLEGYAPTDADTAKYESE